MSKINIWADIFNEWDYNGDDLFYAPLKSVIESAEQLLDTISSIQPGQSAVLTISEDITLEEGKSMEIPSGVTIVLNLAGNKIINEVSSDAAIKNNGNLTINDGVIVNNSTANQGSDAIKNEGGTLIINGGTYGSDTNRGAAVRNNAGTVIINGGTFATIDCGLNQGWAYVFIANGPDAVITINNATSDCGPNGMFAANDGVINVNGGTYRMGDFNKPTYYMAYAENGIVNLNKGTFDWTQGSGKTSIYVDKEGTGAINIAEGVTIKETFKE